MKQTILLIICTVYSIKSYAYGDASITLTSATSIPVKLYKPIDERFQDQLVSKEWNLEPTISITYKLEVNDFVAVRVVMQNRRVNLFLFPGDHVTLNYVDEGRGRIEITGSNATAHTFYNNQYISFGSAAHMNRIQNMALRTTDFGKLVTEIEQTMLREVKDSLKLLRRNSEVSEKLTFLLRNEISRILHFHALMPLQGRKLNEQEKREIENINMKLDLSDFNAFRYPSGSVVSQYYGLLFKNMNDEDKQKILQGHSEDVFGPYTIYLLAPDHIRLPGLANALVIERRMNPSQSFFEYTLDFDEMYRYLKENYPKSEYVALLAKDFETDMLKNNIQQKNAVSFMSQSVTTLSDFSNLPELKGKYLLVDFWATWCFPCIQEFAHKDRIEKILETHENLVCVYISIDEDNRDSQWKSTVERLQLQGHHIRAQKQLVDDIKEKVFQSQQIAIPRYILISPNGKLLNINLPRPSAGNQIAEAIQKYLR